MSATPTFSCKRSSVGHIMIRALQQDSPLFSGASLAIAICSEHSNRAHSGDRRKGKMMWLDRQSHKLHANFLNS